MNYLTPQVQKVISFFCLFFIVFSTQAQVGIGTTAPDESSILDIQSSDKGVLFPRIDLSVNPINNPAEGLIVYNTDASNGGVNSGLVMYSSVETKFLTIVSEKVLEEEINNINYGGTATGGWGTSGNTAASGDFIGTTNWQSLMFKVNNNQVGKFHPNGGISLGFMLMQMTILV